MGIPGLGQERASLLLATDLHRRTALGGLGSGLVTVLLAAGGFRAAAEEATPGILPPIFAEWVAVWADDPAGTATLYTADAVLEDASSGTIFRGREEIQVHVAAEFGGFPGHAYELPIAFVVDEWAAAEWVFTGTYTGTYPGLPPGAGQAVTLRGAAVFRLTDGKIRWEAHYYDAYSFLVQLGLLPSQGETEETPAPKQAPYSVMERWRGDSNGDADARPGAKGGLCRADARHLERRIPFVDDQHRPSDSPI